MSPIYLNKITVSLFEAPSIHKMMGTPFYQTEMVTGMSLKPALKRYQRTCLKNSTVGADPDSISAMAGARKRSAIGGSSLFIVF